MDGRFKIVQGDITAIKADAIVNAANTTLLGGGGVDGAIHRAAGPALLRECETLGGCATGQAKLTRGYRLPAKFVIHAVGPVWSGGEHGEDQLLASCYRESLSLAAKHGIKSVAFPSISTGAYRFPLACAARIAINEITGFLSGTSSIKEVQMVCFDEGTYRAYCQAYEEIAGDKSRAR